MRLIKRSHIDALRAQQLGLQVAFLGMAVVLLWLGIFKFTPTEAMAIKPLLIHHPLTYWVYDAFDTQTVSNVVGIMEIVTAVLLLLSFRYRALRPYAGIGVVSIFLVTLSFLMFTPDVWRIQDGVAVTDFFILKDVVYLGLGIVLLVAPTSNN